MQEQDDLVLMRRALEAARQHRMPFDQMWQATLEHIAEREVSSGTEDQTRAQAINALIALRPQWEAAYEGRDLPRGKYAPPSRNGNGNGSIVLTDPRAIRKLLAPPLPPRSRRKESQRGASARPLLAVRRSDARAGQELLCWRLRSCLRT